MKALIIGATGATGKDLLKVLLGSPDYTDVVAFVRNPLTMEHPKLSYMVTDIVFSCLGTSSKSAGSKDRQWNTDFEIPARFADIAKQNGAPGIVLLSAYGAAVGSRVFYSRIKGDCSEKVQIDSGKKSVGNSRCS